jgi:hypothetical protein
LIASAGNNAGAFGTTKEAIGVNNIVVQHIFTDIQEIPLLPGDAIQVRTNGVNVTLQTSLWWRERFLEESERT